MKFDKSLLRSIGLVVLGIVMGMLGYTVSDSDGAVTIEVPEAIEAPAEEAEAPAEEAEAPAEEAEAPAEAGAE
jgi:hypothetical protein